MGNGREAEKLIANIITSFRIVFSIIMLFCPVFSAQFYGFYIAAGISDMIDGTVARKTGSESEFGAKLDSVADLFFVAAAAVKIFPQISLPKFIWIWTGLIAVVKIARIVVACIRQKKFSIPHSIANKITGFLLFIFPLTIPFVDVQLSAGVVCAVATVATVFFY